MDVYSNGAGTSLAKDGMMFSNKEDFFEKNSVRKEEFVSCYILVLLEKVSCRDAEFCEKVT
jgi:hypothetical protein